MKIWITEDGNIETIGCRKELTELGPVTGKRRVSTIVPVNPFKRLCFRLLRWLFGEDGETAEWTREWRGPWRCTILATSQTYQHESRTACVLWEYETLTKGTE